MIYRLNLSFILLIILLFSLCAHKPVWAQRRAAGEAELPSVKVAFSDDQSIILQRVLYAALKRAGYQMIAKGTGMRTAIADVNYGDAAILPAQTDGWDRMYPNLIKVPVVIENVEFSVYTLTDKTLNFSEWADLEGLRIGYRWQNEYVANNISRTKASGLVRVNDIDELWDTLLNGIADAVILPRFSYYEHRFPYGVKRAGVIERQAVFSYVNNSYDYLAPLLEKAYREMIAGGIMESIHNGGKISGEKPFVLHINSYNAQNAWERSQMEFLRGNLETVFSPESLLHLTASERSGESLPLVYHSIYLNSNEPHSQLSFNGVISEMIRTEFIAYNPDIIIASGNEAFEFAMNNYYLLFPNLPVLFFGVTDIDNSMMYGIEDHVTGVSETISFYETASLMLRLFPGTRRIFVLNDHSLSRSGRIQRNIQNESRALSAEIVFSDDKAFSEILGDIRGFGSDTLVLIGNYLSDSEGAFYSESVIQKLVSQASVNPVFCLTTPFIGHGTLGGLLSSTNIKNNAAASMASVLLKGTSPNEIPVIFDSAYLNQWQFDYETIKRFNINVKNLPADHVLINRRLPIWESNPFEFSLLLTAALLFLLIIFGLIIFSIRSKKMAQNLHHTAMQLEIAAKEANNANEAKSSFLAKMSHEIRTPMNAILGIAEIQLRDETLSPDTEDAIRKIYESGDVLLNIINDILDLSKIEAGKLELVPVKYDIPSLINDTMQLNRLRYDSKPIDLSIKVDENTPHYLFGDELRIKQVLNNIISNAFKYTDEGTVDLYVYPESKNNDSENVTIVFRVCDTGQGMTQEQLGKLFDEYTRFNAKANRETAGTGLGMSITKHLIELMNGDISVKSDQDKGSEFTVRLPQKLAGSDVCGSETVEKLRKFNFRSTMLTKKTQFLREYMPYGSVLIVDDVESNIYVSRGMLLPYGLKIDSAASGFEAIKKIEDGNVYDIVFMDHMMPKMDGIETTKIIRDMGYNHTIVALTANAIIGRAEMFLQNGFDGFISKPVDSRELNLMLNELIRNKKPPEVVEAARKEIEMKKNNPVIAARNSFIDNELKKAAVHDIENVLAVLEDLLKEIKSKKIGADLELFATTVHGMKSALANIGEIQLSGAALRLEYAAKNYETEILLIETPDFLNTLKALMGKLKASETTGDDTLIISPDDRGFLKNKLYEIKTACGILNIKDAKNAIASLRHKKWPRNIINAIDEISMYLIRGEHAKAGSAVDNAMERGILEI